MSEQEQNIETVKKGYQAFSSGDIETVMSLYDDNIEWVQPGESAISGTYHGKAELGELLGRLGEKTTTLTALRFLADGDTVVVLSEATVGGETSQDVEVFTLRDGKAVRAQTYGDTALMERVFGKKQVAAG
jgi:ketosteroid isomerase-like protein